MEDRKIQYLQMIQNVIGRMSTISSVVKGFSVTLFVAVVTIISGDFINDSVLWTLALPLVFLLGLDIYYLSLERKYRQLFEDVRTDKHPVDYSLTLTSDMNTQVSILKCLLSKSILMFHLPIIVIYVLTCLLIR